MPSTGCVLRKNGALAVVGGDGEKDVVEGFEIEHSGSTVSDTAEAVQAIRKRGSERRVQGSDFVFR